MTKVELASYLASLQTLLEAQTKGQHSIASTILADEYTRCWDKLKEVITNETRNRQEHDERPEAGADKQSYQPGSSLKTGDYPGSRNG